MTLGDVPHWPVPWEPSSLTLPLADYTVRAGFPSPADDFNTKRVDLTEELVIHPQATFLLRVKGDSMRDDGIFDDDIVVVDKSIRPSHWHIVVATVDNDFTIKRLYSRGGRIRLKAANPTYPDIVPQDGQTLQVWGVVTACIKQFVKFK